jgi:hypothetical protein
VLQLYFYLVRVYSFVFATTSDQISDKLCCPTSCCCSHCYVYTDCPACLGCEGKSSICCLLEKGSCKFISPTTCLKYKYQMCCCVHRAAVPCDKEVPCALALCGIVCFGKEELDALKAPQPQCIVRAEPVDGKYAAMVA